MRRFNPEKELKKIQRGNKNKVIFGIMTLLFIIALGSSYALYQIRHSKRIIYTTIGPFSSKDLQLAVYVNGVKQKEFPEQSPDMLYGGYECERDSKITFDKEKWSIILETNHPDKCSLRFGTKYEDESGANYPELYQGMIPVYFKEGKIYVADVTNEWYNYDNNEWANAVLIDYEKNKLKFYDDNGNLLGGHEVKEEDILQMYVWIPRYKYELWNVNNEEVEKQIIKIQFEEEISNTGNIKCSYTNNGDGTIIEDCKDKTTQDPVKNTDWYTHPAFTFGDTELKGIWVGKFEPSDPTDENGRTNWNKINEITILPNKTSTVSKKVSTIFNAERDIEGQYADKYNLNAGQIDTHMMKNIEWGAVAYLTQSIYGIYKDEKTCNIKDMNFNECEVWINNTAQGAGVTDVNNLYGGTYTGCVGDSVSAIVNWNQDDGTPAKCVEENRWDKKGVNASTTGNMYGIYDMAGGTFEYVMGVMLENGGAKPCYNADYSGFSDTNMPASKYYDIYTFSDDNTTSERGHLGDATREIMARHDINIGGWNFDNTLFPGGVTTPWFIRGSRYEGAIGSGIFAFYQNHGSTNSGLSFRSVLSAA